MVNYKQQSNINYICNTTFINMKERLLEFLKTENKSSAQLAEEIGVQPSGISHILSGRNNPSLDFVLKMLEKYKFLSTEWLLFGKGPMYKENQITSLFSDESFDGKSDNPEKTDQNSGTVRPGAKRTENELILDEDLVKEGRRNSSISRIIMFYKDKSFEEFNPRV